MFKKKIVTIVGTSLISNHTDSNKELRHLNNLQDANVGQEEIQILRKELNNFKEEQKESLCAEITSIAQIIEELGRHPIQYDLCFIATDTKFSPAIATFLKEWFNCRKEKYSIINSFFNEEKDKISGLKIDDPISFQNEGVNNLLTRLNEIVGNNPEDCIINITGGYKAIVPIMTIYAQLKGVEVKYLFKEMLEEDGCGLEKKGQRRVINIPKFPISIDWNVVEAYKPFLSFKSEFWNKERYMAAKNKLKNQSLPNLNDKEGQQLIENLISNRLIELKDGKLVLTVIGYMVKSINNEKSRGYIMEHVFYHYFSKTDKNKTDYSSIEPIKLNGFYKEENGKVHLCEKNQGGKKIGDIDISLRREKIDVLCECKALSAFKSAVEKNLKSQLIARALQYFKKNPDKNTVELLVLVFQLQFKGFLYSFEEQIKEAIHSLKADIKKYSFGENKKVIFNCLTAQCILKFDKNDHVDYMSFYRNPDIKFEQLN